MHGVGVGGVGVGEGVCRCRCRCLVCVRATTGGSAGTAAMIHNSVCTLVLFIYKCILQTGRGGIVTSEHVIKGAHCSYKPPHR